MKETNNKSTSFGVDIIITKDDRFENKVTMKGVPLFTVSGVFINGKKEGLWKKVFINKTLREGKLS